MSKGSFSLAAYSGLLEALIGRGYVVAGLAEADPAAPHLVLRHDVDFDLGAAVTMAEFEAEKGVTATYFVLLRSEFYNPLSAGAARALTRLSDLGHRIGLHFDAALYPGDPAVLAESARSECGVLGGIVGREVGALSLHRPHPDLLDLELQVDGVINAYGRRFFRDMGYCSDSRGTWRHGHPLDHPAVAAGRALQLLTHPIWWVSDEGVTVQDKLVRFLDRRRDLLDREIARNCDIYSAGLGPERSPSV